MKRCLTFLLVILMLIGIVPLSVSADETKAPKTYEVVLLMDTSGSMVDKQWTGGSWIGSDPEKISIEAAQSFATNFPEQAEYFNVSVVLYNSAVLVGLKNVNVLNQDNMVAYKAFLNEVKSCTGDSKNAADKAFYQKYGFNCWNGDTDIGAAMAEAKKILDTSTAEKKAVVLFSDGRIDLSGENSTQKEAESKQTAFDCTAHFAKNNTSVYTIGLNKAKGEDGVDKDFMEKLATDTNGEFRFCEDQNKVFGFFLDMYAYFTEGTKKPGVEYPVLPNIPTTHTTHIYGQVISQTNLVLFSDTDIKSYTVTNPNGVVVAELKENGQETTSSGCFVHHNDRSITIKLITPTDGNWSVKFTSASAGTVTLSEIYSYSLDVLSDTPEKIVVGDVVNFTPTIFNVDTNTRVTTKEIYENAQCVIGVSKSGSNDIYTAELNSAHNAYKLSLPFNAPGEYTIEYKIKHDQFEAIATKKLTVANPKLVLSTETANIQVGKPVTIVGKLVNPLTSQPMDVPDHLSDFDLSATITLDGKTLSTIPVNYTSGKEFSFTYTPEKTGAYQISASIKSYTETISSDNSVSFTSWVPTFDVTANKTNAALGDELSFIVKLKNPADGSIIALDKHLANAVLNAEIKCNGTTVSTLTATVKEGDENIVLPFKPTTAGNYSVTLSVKDSASFENATVEFAVSPSTIASLKELSSIKKGVIFGKATVSLTLGEYFADSDNDALIYEVTSDSNKISVEVVDSVLKISASGGAKGTVTLVVRDGRGAEQTATISVKVTSYLPLIIILIVLIICILIAIPVILIILKKRQTIRMKYRIKLTMNGYSMVYDVNRASNNRFAKPVMTVKEVLTLASLTTCAGGDMSESDAQRMIQLFCNQITVTGFPFKEGIKIKVPGKKDKIFLRFSVTIPLDSKDESITDAAVIFGKTTDFRD